MRYHLHSIQRINQDNVNASCHWLLSTSQLLEPMTNEVPSPFHPTEMVPNQDNVNASCHWLLSTSQLLEPMTNEVPSPFHPTDQSGPYVLTPPVRPFDHSLSFPLTITNTEYPKGKDLSNWQIGTEGKRQGRYRGVEIAPPNTRGRWGMQPPLYKCRKLCSPELPPTEIWPTHSTHR